MQPAELQEKGPSSLLSPFLQAPGKTLYLPMTATATEQQHPAIKTGAHPRTRDQIGMKRLIYSTQYTD